MPLPITAGAQRRGEQQEERSFSAPPRLCGKKTALTVALLAAASAGSGQPVRFNRDIRPIMSDTCFRCHGPDARVRQAGMRLDIREEALKATRSGVIPIVPGDPDKSAIIRRVFADDPAKRMPPQSAHRELTAAQKDTIRQWVSEGAKYEGHWAYEQVKRPAVPELPLPVQNPVDAFIQERLMRERLDPSPEADRRTLLRRVTFDLTGLPPTPEELKAFAGDPSPGAYERAVDRLLLSPGYAEEQARHWLDAVRFADSAGFHGDNLVPVWPYRDYVLRAFRDNKPFDQFTREQLAGDLLPDAGIDPKVASAYNRLNRVSAEGGLQPKEYLAKYGADRVRTLSTVWLGATLGCAECHDHRFDPIKSKDFYSMKAFFADIKETGLVSDRGANAWGAKLLLPSSEQEARLKQLDKELAQAKGLLKEKAQLLEERRWDWEGEVLKEFESGDLAWRYQRPLSAKSLNGATLTIYNEELVDSNYYINGSLASERKRGEGLVVAGGVDPDNDTYAIQFKPGKGAWTALGIDVFQDESLPGNRLSRGADRFVLTEVEAELSPGLEAAQPPQKLAFLLATSTGFGETPEHPAMAAIDGNAKTGWAVSYGEARNPFLALRFAGMVITGSDSVIIVRLRHDSDYRRAAIGRFRIALSASEHSWPESGDSARKKKKAASEPEPAQGAGRRPASASSAGLATESGTLTIATDLGLAPEVLSALRLPEDERKDDQKKAVLEYFEWAFPELQPLVVRVAQLEAEKDMFEASIPRVVFTERTRPRVTRVLGRGNWMDESGEIVQPAIPAFVGRLNTNGRRANRLDLANWIVSPDNPFTARVFVNRLWRQFFGTGLSKVLEDLGSQGEWPTHPELLDWLAAEFTQPSGNAVGAHPWDMRHIIRVIVTSRTYRQSSLSRHPGQGRLLARRRPGIDERDPENRLLARQSRFRADAETVHDVALAVSGLLVDKFGGPSVMPYEPAGYLAAMNFPKREYSASRRDGLYRRALYTQWQRTFLHPSLLAFDAPTREECAVNRVNSNTPIQALVLLNDPIFVEAARVFAGNILREGGRSFDARLDWAFARALNRKPQPEEHRILADLYRKNRARFEADRGDAAQFVSVGETPLPADTNVTELAAMATVARAILNLHETITRN